MDREKTSSFDLTRMSSATLDSTTSLSALQSRLHSRLVRVRRAMRGRFLAEAMARVLAALLVVLVLSLWLDWWLELSRVGRLGFATAGLGLVGWVAWRHLVQPVTMALEPLDVAAAIDRRRVNGEVRVAPQVASVLQLPEHLDETRGSSPEMIEAAVRENYESLERIDFKEALSGRHLLASIAIAVVSVMIPAGFVWAQPHVAGLWAERWLEGSDRPWPRNTFLEVVGVEDGRFIVPRGEPATLQVLVTDEQYETEVVHMRMRSESGRDETVTLTRFELGDFRYDLPPLQQEVRVQIWGGDGDVDPFLIVPIDRPRIVDLMLTARHPRNAEPTVHHFRGDEGTVRLLPETAAELLLTANVAVAEIDVETTSGEPLEFERIAEDVFVTRWTHQGPIQTRIILTSREAGLVSHPRPVTIGERPDRSPRLSLRHSGVRQRITPTATVPLEITARDDFGVESVSLNVETPQLGIAGDGSTSIPDAQSIRDASARDDDSGAVTIGERIVYGPRQPAEETTVEEHHSIEVSGLRLSPNGVLTVQALATDDCFTGKQQTESRKTVFRVVKPEELFKEILLRQQQLRSRLRKQYEAAIELRDEIRVAAIPDEASRLLRTHQLIRREVGQVSSALDASALEMRLNKLGGPETWELIESSVLRPLSQLHDSEMELQRQALASLVTDEPQPIDRIIDQQQSLVDALKRILDNMAQWDSFIDVVNQLNTVIKLETRVRQQTEALRAKQVESIFD